MTVLEFAAAAEIAPSTVYAHIERGAIHAGKWSGVIVIPQSELPRFLTVQPLHDLDAGQVRHG